MKRIKNPWRKPLPEPKLIKEPITFSPLEWDYFVEEVKLRGIDKFEVCINNAKYLAKLDQSEASEYCVVATLDELNAIAGGASLEDLGGIVNG
ncbi:MAG: hypothetical protein IJG33_01180 [Selenomonadaceae bacterium]|nr:hypothetical protein [Selenomonadaceae bacterium]MBQ3441835.1 hypothetical protein [Selenomonadaceae bacterium]MBQ6757607.1 hypothetical protein [Selenomonadaceae bacterium]MBR0102475.1 hypothetical protein [Selenomonadaceae bacterium]MBR6713116.1 hypothetical protein [Selenomonadaceae bacterium]